MNPIDAQEETYPLQPKYHPVHRITRLLYDFLASARLAMFLLVAILLSCIAGVTFFKPQDAWNAIFGAIWFNALLVVLVANVACCFFGRIRGRRITVVSFGMIMFHLSFVTMFAGIVYNSLYSFNGFLRLTEGETLSNSDPANYDEITYGRLFSMERLRGTTTLNKVVAGFTLDGVYKRVAYDVTVGEPHEPRAGRIYVTNNLQHKGFHYIPDREGYSILVVATNKEGETLYGGFVPLQSLKQKDNTFNYTTGSKSGPGLFPFGPDQQRPLCELQVSYSPDNSKERSGHAYFLAIAPGTQPTPLDQKRFEQSKTAIGAFYDAGDFYLSPQEVRYWAAMNVKYDPGKPIVLTSLWAGLFGMILTTVGRMCRQRS